MKNPTTSQHCAINSRHNQILVVAGPGSGKTATTIARIENLIASGSDPRGIVAITFTNAAAREIDKRLGFTHKLGHVGTLHSFAMKMLKEHGTAFGYGQRMSIISPESAKDILAGFAASLGCKTKMDDLLELKALGRPVRDVRMSVAETVISAYYDELVEHGLLDFDSILTEFNRMLTTGWEQRAMIANAYAYLFVDEVQDSAEIDWSIYESLPINSKFFVGDPDQAIYGFRGGSLDGMMNLACRIGCEVIKLETNFRSRSEICAAAQSLIEHNSNRIEKTTASHNGAGGVVLKLPPAQNAGQEIAMIAEAIRLNPGKEIAVLCRTNAIAFEIQQGLKAAGLPVVERERSTLPRDWPRAKALVELLVNPENNMLAMFYLQKHNPTTTAAMIRSKAAAAGMSINAYRLRLPTHETAAQIVAEVHCRIDRESAMLISEIAMTLTADATPAELALAVASFYPETKPMDATAHGVQVMTIHASKGREFDSVFLAGFEDEIIPGKPRWGVLDIEEERRLAYVAITRARSYVAITSAINRTTTWGQIVTHQPSRFIAEMQ